MTGRVFYKELPVRDQDLGPNWENFKAAYPAEAALIADSHDRGDVFMHGMLSQIFFHGKLSPAQMEAVRKRLAKVRVTAENSSRIAA